MYNFFEQAAWQRYRLFYLAAKPAFTSLSFGSPATYIQLLAFGLFKESFSLSSSRPRLRTADQNIYQNTHFEINMKSFFLFALALLAAASVSAFAPTFQRKTANASGANVQLCMARGKPAKSQEEDLELTRAVIMKHVGSVEDYVVDDDTDDSEGESIGEAILEKGKDLLKDGLRDRLREKGRKVKNKLKTAIERESS